METIWILILTQSVISVRFGTSHTGPLLSYLKNEKATPNESLGCIPVESPALWQIICPIWDSWRTFILFFCSSYSCWPSMSSGSGPAQARPWVVTTDQALDTQEQFKMKYIGPTRASNHINYRVNTEMWVTLRQRLPLKRSWEASGGMLHLEWAQRPPKSMVDFSCKESLGENEQGTRKSNTV